MIVNIKRIDQSLPMPEYQTDGSAAFDLYSREDIVASPRAITRIPSNLIIETPSGYALIVVLRSSTPKRKGFIFPGGIGIIDSDYRGPEDEIHIQIYNITDKPVEIKRGERIAQAIFVQIPKVEFTENELSSNNSRGGFGSTGS